MASFIELPRLTSTGEDHSSIYVNTDDIVAFQRLYDGQTRVEIRALGNEGYAVNLTSPIPLIALTTALAGLARHPGISEWADATKEAWSAPVKDNLRKAAEAAR